MLFTLIRNEFRKLVRRPKTWIVFALFAVFIGIMVFGTFKGDKNMRYYSSPEYQLENEKNNLDYYNDEIDRINEMDEEKKAARAEELQTMISSKKLSEESIKAYEEMIKNGDSKESWKLQLDSRILETKEYIDRLEKQGIDEHNQSWYLQEKQDLEYYTYLKDNNIEPLFGWEYEQFGYMKNLMQLLGMSMLVAGIAVFMSDIVSGECTPATLKFLLVQPIKRGQVLLSKFIAVVVTVVGMILGLEAVGFGIVSLTTKIKGSASLPVIIGKIYESKINAAGFAELTVKPGTGYMVTNAEMLFRALLIQTLFIITTCAVVFMISSIIKSSMVTMGVSVLALVFTGILSMVLNPVKKFAHLFFVNYGDTMSLLNGNSALMYNNVNMTVNMGVIVMLVTILVSYIIAHVVFTNKDILI